MKAVNNISDLFKTELKTILDGDQATSGSDSAAQDEAASGGTATVSTQQAIIRNAEQMSDVAAQACSPASTDSTAKRARLTGDVIRGTPPSAQKPSLLGIGSSRAQSMMSALDRGRRV